MQYWCEKLFDQKTLKAALELKLFDRFTTPQRPEEVARAAGLDPVITASLCRYLAELGLLEQEGELYRVGALGKLYLCSEAPWFQERVLQTLKGTFKLWEGLAERALKGPLPVTEEAFFGEDHIHALAAEALCGELQRTVRIVAELPDFWRAKRLLDLGGRHGLYAVAFAKLCPKLEVCVFDLPAVLSHTACYAQEHGGSSSSSGATSGRTNWGKGYDGIFFAYNPGVKSRSSSTKSTSVLTPRSSSRWKKVEAQAFAGPPLGKIGDALDSRILVACKSR